jgi:hypothetical protein
MALKVNSLPSPTFRSRFLISYRGFSGIAGVGNPEINQQEFYPNQKFFYALTDHRTNNRYHPGDP